MHGKPFHQFFLLPGKGVFSHFFLIFMGLEGILVAPAYSMTNIFTAQSLVRSVDINGQIKAFDLGAGQVIKKDYGKEDSTTTSQSTLSVGMSLELPEASSFAQGVASQEFRADGDGLYFSSIADVNVAGSPAYPFNVEGEGAAHTAVRYCFAVTTETEVVLQMSSIIGDFRDEDFYFNLADKDGRIIWASTGYVGESGIPSRDYKKYLTLFKGDYVLQTGLSAYSTMTGGAAFPGRTSAQFSITAITAVPELPSWGMALAGLGLIGLRMHRR
ncbi:hypothetical protein EIP75_23530 [Aquabacterium soli]|uniref:PEP-CTERM protein-sorting domain-containing protein n=1 Tax=Aquabacterium soli TaxID=2493092 RepID=A0A426UZC9_9BURK|nr:hypothetical protein [Aquabacterium soli]RRR99917.1 hypothetical protein EIP75_23530 [Aquabacterium soli]